MDKVIATGFAGFALFGSGASVVAQGVFDTSATAIERYIGGGVLIVAATLIVRWTFKLLAVIREDAAAARRILEEERKAWAEERQKMREELHQARIEIEDAHLRRRNQ